MLTAAVPHSSDVDRSVLFDDARLNEEPVRMRIAESA